MNKMIFCFISLLPLGTIVCAQTETGQLVGNAKEHKLYVGNITVPLGDALHSRLARVVNEPYFKGLAMQFIDPAQTSKSFFLMQNTALPQNLFYCRSGWVCRQEWKLEKVTYIPLKFRLGSKEMVDYLEGKELHQ